MALPAAADRFNVGTFLALAARHSGRQNPGRANWGGRPPRGQNPSIVGSAHRRRQGQSMRRRRLLVVLVAVGVGAVLAGVLATLVGGGGRAPVLVPRNDISARDPLAFSTKQQGDLEQAAALGFAHVLYTKSPGGVVASAQRTARFRPLVERAVSGSGIDADTLEAIVFLESAGRPNAIAGSDPAGAAGLTQILAETGRDFLGMSIDLQASRRLTRQIAAATGRGDQARVDRLQARRRRVDARFDPAQALAATVHYLQVARTIFGRNDLAVVSYHMGIGNLEAVIRDYASTETHHPIRQLVATAGISWARLYFDSSPIHHVSVWRRLTAFGDDSQTYYWRVLAAKEIMRLFRTDIGKLEQLAALQRAKASAEDVLHPPGTSEHFRGPGDIAGAWGRGHLQPLPNEPARLHFRIDPEMGKLAPRLGVPTALYRGLRPEALALLLYLAQRVRTLSRAATPLTVTSTVRDDAYQRLLDNNNRAATTPIYSLDTTGFAFDILRRYASGAQATAFQYELDQLQAHNLIAWVREPEMIHVTVSTQAQPLIAATLMRQGPPRRT
jgi:hypothetical protein